MRRLLIIIALLAASETSLCVHAISPPHSTSSSLKQRRRRTQKSVTNAAACDFGPRAAEILCARGGEVRSDNASENPPPSIYWAVLHNWLYFVSLGFNLINIQFLIREIIDGDAKATPSARSIALSGKVESVDKLLTFLGIGFLASLSDKFGRKPLMIWSSLGFALTNIIQATTKQSAAMLYLADFVDGCSSCMLPLCQAYIADVSKPEKLAGNLGIFQGLSAGGAFIFAFPIGGLLGSKYGPRLPLVIAAGLQVLNALILIFLTPESNQNKTTKLDLSEANPISGLKKLFGNAPILRTAAVVYFLASLARSSLDAQFTNYASIRFGWTQAQSGPVLVLVGLMLAVAPRLFISYFGIHNAILAGLLTFGFGLTVAGLAPTPPPFIFGIFVTAIGCMALPALQAVMANLAKPGERGALLGAVGSVTELTGAIGSTMYAVLLAKFTADGALLGGKFPGAHFFVAASLLLTGWGIAVHGFGRSKDHPAVKGGVEIEEYEI